MSLAELLARMNSGEVRGGKVSVEGKWVADTQHKACVEKVRERVVRVFERTQVVLPHEVVGDEDDCVIEVVPDVVIETVEIGLEDAVVSTGLVVVADLAGANGLSAFGDSVEIPSSERVELDLSCPTADPVLMPAFVGGVETVRNIDAYEGEDVYDAATGLTQSYFESVTDDPGVFEAVSQWDRASAGALGQLCSPGSNTAEVVERLFSSFRNSRHKRLLFAEKRSVWALVETDEDAQSLAAAVSTYVEWITGRSTLIHYSGRRGTAVASVFRRLRESGLGLGKFVSSVTSEGYIRASLALARNCVPLEVEATGVTHGLFNFRSLPRFICYVTALAMARGHVSEWVWMVWDRMLLARQRVVVEPGGCTSGYFHLLPYGKSDRDRLIDELPPFPVGAAVSSVVKDCDLFDTSYRFLVTGTGGFKDRYDVADVGLANSLTIDGYYSVFNYVMTGPVHLPSVVHAGVVSKPLRTLEGGSGVGCSAVTEASHLRRDSVVGFVGEHPGVEQLNLLVRLVAESKYVGPGFLLAGELVGLIACQPVTAKALGPGSCFQKALDKNYRTLVDQVYGKCIPLVLMAKLISLVGRRDGLVCELVRVGRDTYCLRSTGLTLPDAADARAVLYSQLLQVLAVCPLAKFA